MKPSLIIGFGQPVTTEKNSSMWSQSWNSRATNCSAAAAAFRRVRVADGYRLLLEQLLESSGEVTVLAGEYRRLAGVLDPKQVVGVWPGYGVLQPGEIELIHSLG